MSEFADNPIPQGTRKNTEYIDDQRAQLALNIERTDGGMLRIPILSDVRSSEEREGVQRNTLISVIPMGRLPGYDKSPKSPKGGLPRRGRIYLFRQNVLWRELVADGQGKLFEVDVAHWREIARQGGEADARAPVGIEQHLILLPMLLQGRFVGDQFCMAYSEIAWSWEYIDWLESEPHRVKARCQNIARAWDTAVAASERWTTTQANPSMPISKIRAGLRARDFNIESALKDPRDFEPAFSNFGEQSLTVQLQMRQEQLAHHLNHESPPPLPELEVGLDLLAEYGLRDNKHLVGIILDDPLFGVRHASAQIRQCVAYLQTLNALVPHQPHGQYAQMLYSVAGSQSSLKNEIEWPKLHEVVFEKERTTCRAQMAVHFERLVDLLDGKVPVILQDWICRKDGFLLEPYSLMAEALGALERLPAQADAMFTGKESEELAESVAALVQKILLGEHPLGALLLANDPVQHPVLLKRLLDLREIGNAPDPDAMGLSTLLLGAEFFGDVDLPSVGKSLSYFISDLLDIFGTTVVAHISRLSQQSVKIKLDRVFTPTFTTLSALSKKMSGIQLVPLGEALTKEYLIIGLQGGGLRNGLTDGERSELTRKSYRYATLHDPSGTPLGSTSPKGISSAGSQFRDVYVIAAPKGHPELERYNEFRLRFSTITQALEKTKIVPTLMVGFAIYNLATQLTLLQSFKPDAEGLRNTLGVAGALYDLSAAVASHSKLFFGSTTEQYLLRPRLNVIKISANWARNLENQTGSPRLSLIRAIGGTATLFGATLSAWDSYRAFQNENHMLSASYGVMTAGSGIWGAYALGLIINPWALAIGVIFTIGGMILANVFSDSDAELVVRNGPFGIHFADGQSQSEDTSREFSHLNTPAIAYQQLVGTLGKPKIKVLRLEAWRREATEVDLKVLQEAELRRKKLTDTDFQTVRPDKQALKEDDWVIILNSPLLSTFTNDPPPRLLGQEFRTTLDTTQAFATKQFHRLATPAPKLTAVPLSDASLLYVVPTSFDKPLLSARDRYSIQMTTGLRVSAQIELPFNEGGGMLVLPQPNPKRWKAFTEGHRRVPPANQQPENPPLYWQIEIVEFPV